MVFDSATISLVRKDVVAASFNYILLDFYYLLWNLPAFIPLCEKTASVN